MQRRREGSTNEFSYSPIVRMKCRSTSSTPFITITMIGLPVMRARMRWKSRWCSARASKSPRSDASAASLMFWRSSSRSAGVARAQASRTLIDSNQMRASVSCAGWIEPMWYMSSMPEAMASPLPSQMKAPPVAPFCNRIRPACSSDRRASRKVLRDTPNCSASARSAGRRLPICSRPSASSLRIWAAISSKARAERIAWNWMDGPGRAAETAWDGERGMRNLFSNLNGTHWAWFSNDTTIGKQFEAGTATPVAAPPAAPYCTRRLMPPAS